MVCAIDNKPLAQSLAPGQLNEEEKSLPTKTKSMPKRIKMTVEEVDFRKKFQRGVKSYKE